MAKTCIKCSDGSWVCGDDPKCDTNSVHFGYIQVGGEAFEVSVAGVEAESRRWLDEANLRVKIAPVRFERDKQGRSALVIVRQDVLKELGTRMPGGARAKAVRR